jgi:predicted Zn finger-like uncharacterized protein
MIVDCHSCGATYNISDEKVRGRRVRVRCKSCGEGIIVDGMRLDAEDATRVYAPNFEPAAYTAGREEATRVMSVPSSSRFGEPGPEDWTVNISDSEQRIMRLDEIVNGYASGLVSDSAYVWKDGMADWLPLNEVPEIRAALEYVETTRVVSPSSLKPPSAHRPPPPPAAGPQRTERGLETPRMPSSPPPMTPRPSVPVLAPPPPPPPPMGMGMTPPPPAPLPAAVPTQVAGFPVPPPPPGPVPAATGGRAKVTYSAPAPPPRAFAKHAEPASTVEYAPPVPPRAPPARVKEGRVRADLFGGHKSAGKEEEDLLRSESVPLNQYGDKPTAARNESSVLFSLDAMKAGQRRGSPSSAPPRASAAAPPTAADILGMPAAGAGLLSAPAYSAPALSAPMAASAPAWNGAPPPALTAQARTLPPQHQEAYAPRAKMDTTPPMSRGRPKMAIIIGVVLGAALVAGAAAFVFKDRFLTPKLAPDATETAAVATTAPTHEPPRAAEPPPPVVKAPPPTTTVAAEPVAPAEPPHEAPRAEAKPAVAPRPVPAPRPAPASQSTDAPKAAVRKDPSEQKVVLAEDPTPAAEAPPAATPPPEEAPSAPPFDTGAAKAALASAASGAAGCKTADGPTGSGKVQVTFAPSGKATSATLIEGDFGGTPIAGCVAKLFRGARVPAFSGDPVTVAKSFTIPE